MENKVIVFGFNHINALGITRSLGEKNIKPICVIYGPNKGMVLSSKYPSKKCHVNTLQDGYNFILDNYKNQKLKPIIFCSNDDTASIIDNNYLELKDHFYIANARRAGRITEMMDKFTISSMAGSVGFTSPQSVVVNKGDLLPVNISYPCFTKSIMTIKGGKKDVFLCHNEEELNEALQSIRSEKVLIQEYISKKNEICLQGFSIKEGRKIFIPYVEKFYRFTENEFGGYVYFEKYQNQKKEFINKIEKLIRSTQYTGLFSIEFLVDQKDNLFFTEINFRHDGFSYFTTSGGANLPYVFCKSLISDDLELDGIVLKDHFTGMNELTDFFQFVRTKKLSVFKWLIQCLRADSHLLFNRKDVKPFIHMMLEYVKIAWSKYLLKRI